jgi:hypothetical protein
MMSSLDKHTYDDQTLTRYLLGGLPPDVTERLDELSVSDDELAGRLSAIENDLVDAYVRGEMSGEQLAQFESFYLSSPKRREKVQFARALWDRERGAAPAAARATPESSESKPVQLLPLARKFPRLSLQWGFAAAAAVLLFMAGSLLLENLRLEKQARDARSAFEQRERQMQTELSEQRSATDAARQELERLRSGQTNPDQLKTISLLLMPQMRGVSTIPSVSLRPGTDLLVLVLTLESDDFPEYRVELKDPGTSRVVWRSPMLTSTSSANKKTVAVSLPAGQLRQQNYIVEVTGVPARGAPENVGGYPFRVVVR